MGTDCFVFSFSISRYSAYPPLSRVLSSSVLSKGRRDLVSSDNKKHTSKIVVLIHGVDSGTTRTGSQES